MRWLMYRDEKAVRSGVASAAAAEGRKEPGKGGATGRKKEGSKERMNEGSRERRNEGMKQRQGEGTMD